MDIIALIRELQDTLRLATRHVLARDAKFIDVDGGFFRKYLVNCSNFVT
jgi:hypothetical protein